MRSIEASAGTSGRQMRLLTGQSSEFRVYSSLQTANRLTQGCSPNAMPVSPQELAARLVDTCLHELPRLLRPYALKLLKPRGSMARSTASCSTCPDVGYTAAVRTARVRAALHGMKKGSPRALAARRKGEQIHPRTMLQQFIHRGL